MGAQGGRTGLRCGAGLPRHHVLERPRRAAGACSSVHVLNLAATQEQDAEVQRDMAASEMTPDEVAEAQRLAREWKPKPAATPSP